MFGLYLHIPFCRKACVYCNFHFSTLLKYKPTLLKAMWQELELRVRNAEFAGQKIRSIYFGGGTPGLLTIAELATLFAKIRQSYVLENEAEITLELNPENVNKDFLKACLDLGINRFSLGIQSFCDNTLRYLGRDYDADFALKALEMLLSSGANLSCDLILGTGASEAKPIEYSLEILTTYQVPHIAAYLLTIEPKTMLGNWIKRKQTPPICEEKQRRDFLATMHFLQNQGYEQYELSNYALPNHRAVHNSGYWHGIPYLGLGPGAHSYDGKNRRSWNVANNALYIQAIAQQTLPATEEFLDERNLYNEYILNRIRLIEGIDLTDLEKRFSKDYVSYFYSQILELNSLWFCSENNTFALTEQGKLFADSVSLSLIR